MFPSALEGLPGAVRINDLHRAFRYLADLRDSRSCVLLNCSDNLAHAFRTHGHQELEVFAAACRQVGRIDAQQSGCAAKVAAYGQLVGMDQGADAARLAQLWQVGPRPSLMSIMA